MFEEIYVPTLIWLYTCVIVFWYCNEIHEPNTWYTKKVYLVHSFGGSRVLQQHLLSSGESPLGCYMLDGIMAGVHAREIAGWDPKPETGERLILLFVFLGFFVCLFCFWDRVLLYSLSWLWTLNPPAQHLPGAGITGMHQHSWFNISLSLFLLLCWVGVHCGIYKSSYNVSNISYLNSLPSTILLYPLLLPILLFYD
jgi:hypothetical protein